MTRWQRLKAFVKEDPWRATAYVVAGGLALQTINALLLVKMANKQGDEIEKANQMLGWIAEAIEKGWDLVLLEDGIIDILVDKEMVVPSQALQAS